MSGIAGRETTHRAQAIDFRTCHRQIPADEVNAMKARNAKFQIGQIVRHRVYPFRGVIFDVDPEYDNTEEWWNAIPEEVRPSKDQPFYHLFAENDETEYVAYVSEQNLIVDDSGKPVRHPQIGQVFDRFEKGLYHTRPNLSH
jgi:heat shock protein HspQ